MASPRSPLRWLRVLAIVTAIALPAVAVSTVDASAGSRTAHHPSGESGDDMNLIRTALNAARGKDLRARAGRAAAHRTAAHRTAALRTAAGRTAAKRTATLRKTAPRAPAPRQRASRSLVRRALPPPDYVRPVPGPVTQWYGTHPGIDIAPPYGTPVGAAHAGIVTFVGWDDGYGMHVEVRQPNGYVTTYSHLSAFAVKVGDVVRAGWWVGAVGSTGYSTGPHLHFEVHVPGGARMDPAVWLREHGVTV